MITPAPRLQKIPTLLDFPAPEVRTYPPETVVAEKFQAMVSLGIASTRLKDFFDVWTLGRGQEFDGVTLARAIEATFRRRNTPIPTDAPLALTDAFGLDAEKQSQWRRFLARGRLADAPEDLAEVVAARRIPPSGGGRGGRGRTARVPLGANGGMEVYPRIICQRGWQPTILVGRTHTNAVPRPASTQRKRPQRSGLGEIYAIFLERLAPGSYLREESCEVI